MLNGWINFMKNSLQVELDNSWMVALLVLMMETPLRVPHLLEEMVLDGVDLNRMIIMINNSVKIRAKVELLEIISKVKV